MLSWKSAGGELKASPPVAKERMKTMDNDVLYHVSFDINNTDTMLVPSVPYTAGEDEDRHTKRICLTPTIAKCMEAMSPHCRNVSIGSVVRVWKVYKSAMDYRLLVSPRALYNSRKVPDALETEEYWYLAPIMTKVRSYMIEDFEAYTDLGWTLIKREDVLKVIHELNIFGIRVNANAEAHEIYKEFMNACQERKLYDIEDAVWDRLAELPWVQRRIIKGLKLKEIV